MIELTKPELRKVVLKRILSLVFVAAGGYQFFRLLAKPAVTIIIYHRIIRNDHSGVQPYISVAAANLRQQIQFFKKYYEVISLEEAMTLLNAGPLNKKYLVLTFDDGYEDNWTLGGKIFTEEAVIPTVFITTECVAKRESLWPDRLRHIVYSAVVNDPVVMVNPDFVVRQNLQERIGVTKQMIAYAKGLSITERETFLLELAKKLSVTEQCPPLMLDSKQVKLLSEQGVSIGAHTVNHPVLSQISAEVAEREICESMIMLKEWTGREIVTFAYPNGRSGDFTDLTVSQLRSAGYCAGVTTMRGVNRPGCDLFRLRRTGIYLTDSLAEVKMKLALESLL